MRAVILISRVEPMRRIVFSCKTRNSLAAMSAKYPSLQLRKADRLRDVAQYNNSLSSTVASLSQCTLELTQLTLRSVERLYRAGFAIKKAGIVLSELETEASAPRRLWQDDEKRQALMRVMDALNNGEHKARGLA